MRKDNGAEATATKHNKNEERIEKQDEANECIRSC